MTISLTASFTELSPHSSQIAPTLLDNLCQQLVLFQSSAEATPGSYSARFYCLLSLIVVESRPRRKFTLGDTHLLIRICHFLLFIVKQIYVLLLIEFYVNRLNDLMRYSPILLERSPTSNLKASSFKFQYSFNTNNSSARQQRVLNNNKKFFTFKMS